MTASSQRYQAPELARSRDYFTGIEVGVVLSGSSVLSRYEILPPRFARAPTQPAGSILRTHLWVCSVPQERLPAWQVSCFSRSSEMSSPVTFTLLLTDSFNKSECHFTTCLLAGHFIREHHQSVKDASGAAGYCKLGDVTHSQSVLPHVQHHNQAWAFDLLHRRKLIFMGDSITQHIFKNLICTLAIATKPLDVDTDVLGHSVRVRYRDTELELLAGAALGQQYTQPIPCFAFCRFKTQARGHRDNKCGRALEWRGADTPRGRCVGDSCGDCAKVVAWALPALA